MNVDGFIVRHNVSRAVQGESVDIPYLASLSSDSLPTLVDEFQDVSLPGYTRDAVGAALVCHAQIASGGDPNWRSFTFSRLWADRARAGVQPQLDEYQVLDADWPVKVLTPGSIYYECYPGGTGD
jgi:hypothetical protein